MIDYSVNLVKTYDLWDLFLHANQYPYPGRSYAWAKSEAASDLSDMSKAERDEFYDRILPDWENAVSLTFGEEFGINEATFGNTTRHLHRHLIPRFARGRLIFEGVEFVDPNPAGNYAPYNRSFKLPEQVFLKIRNNIKSALEQDK